MFDIEKIQNVHFVGIGGIGISAVARMMHFAGKHISGSDRSVSKITDDLKKLGIEVVIGHAVENIPADVELVVYTNALAENNLELVEARRRGVLLLSYPEMLGEISRDKYTIAVSGTHGKTTTTAMIAGILRDGGLDPTVIVGSLLKSEDSNFISGKSRYFVAEADEYKKSFLQLHPNILVVNNIDKDHLDYYKDLADIQKAFQNLAERVPADGYIVCDTSNPHVAPILHNLRCTIIEYPQYKHNDMRLQVAGEHNRLNAAAAFAVGKILSIEDAVIRGALGRFEGTWRRFELKGTTQRGALVFDDYAHNPQKVRAALQGAREKFPNKKITVVFQPHLYSRTKFLLHEFSHAFGDAENVIIAPIYAAREEPDTEISSEILADAVRNIHGEATCMNSFEEITSHLQETAGAEDVIVTMGAGDIFKIGEALI